MEMEAKRGVLKNPGGRKFVSDEKIVSCENRRGEFDNTSFVRGDFGNWD